MGGWRTRNEHPIHSPHLRVRAQGLASAPVWDSSVSSINAVISASDFINILTQLRHSVNAGASPLSDAEMDAHTIRWVRAAVAGFVLGRRCGAAAEGIGACGRSGGKGGGGHVCLDSAAPA